MASFLFNLIALPFFLLYIALLLNKEMDSCGFSAR